MMTNVTFTSRLTKTALVTLGLAVASAALAPGQARADSLTFDASPKTGDPASVSVTLDDTTNPGSITVTVNVVPEATTGNIGDINGVYFNLPDGIGAVSVSSVSGGPVNLAASDLDGNAGDLGDGVNMNGGGGTSSFDLGIRIGYSGGINDGDDYQTTTFTLSGEGLSLSSFTAQSFGVRLKSVGPAGGSREGSSKVAETTPSTVVVSEPSESTSRVDEPVATNPGGSTSGGYTDDGGSSEPVAVPEPTTIAGLMMGFGGLIAARRRQANKNG